MSRKINVSDEQIIFAAHNNPTASKAACSLGIKYDTYRVHAIRLNVFFKNQGAKGTKKIKNDPRKIPLNDILDGKCPQYQTNKLRKRLISEGVKEHKCEICGIESWLGKKLALELDHIDGDRYNNNLNNLRIICPNCHSQTETYRGKNKASMVKLVNTTGLKPVAERLPGSSPGTRTSNFC